MTLVFENRVGIKADNCVSWNVHNKLLFFLNGLFHPDYVSERRGKYSGRWWILCNSVWSLAQWFRNPRKIPEQKLTEDFIQKPPQYKNDSYSQWGTISDLALLCSNPAVLNLFWFTGRYTSRRFSEYRYTVARYTRVYPKVSGLAAWSENCKWYSSLPLDAVVSLFCESV
jgi:hypothetical protein